MPDAPMPDAPMPDAPPFPPPAQFEAAGLDLTGLAERMIAHRLARPDRARLLGDGDEPAPLLDMFRRAARVFALQPAPDRRIPADGALGVVSDALLAAIGAHACRLTLADPGRGDFYVLRGDGSLGDEVRIENLCGIAGQVYADGVGRIGHGTSDAALPGEHEMLCVALRRYGENHRPARTV